MICRNMEYSDERTCAGTHAATLQRCTHNCPYAGQVLLGTSDRRRDAGVSA